MRLHAKVATMYYTRGLSQEDIAERLRLSRHKVQQLLAEARHVGIVRIEIHPPIARAVACEQRLREWFGLDDVYVVRAEHGEPIAIRRLRLAVAAAECIGASVRDGTRIGVCGGGPLLAEVVAATQCPPEKRCGVRVVQALGRIGVPEPNEDVAVLVYRLAQRFDATPTLLDLPAVLASAESCCALRSDPRVGTVLAQLDDLDVAIAAIETTTTTPLHEMRRELARARAAGEIALRFVNDDGAFVRTSRDERIVGMTADQLYTVPRLIAIGAGPRHGRAMHAVLRSGVVNVLITDEPTAHAIDRRSVRHRGGVAHS